MKRRSTKRSRTDVTSGFSGRMGIESVNMIRPKLVMIGGSAGSYRVVTSILSQISPDVFDIPLVLCLHRLKTVRNGFAEALNFSSRIKVVEPNDKDPIRPGKVYLAPANYHLSIELGKTFALSTEEMVNNSRPAIDLLFGSGGYVYRKHAMGIVLSGANKDGALGLCSIARNGGQTVVQDPDEAEIIAMPSAAIEATQPDHILTSNGIVKYLDQMARLPLYHP